MTLKLRVLAVSVLCLSAQAVGNDGIIIRKNQRTLEQVEHIYAEMSRVRYRPPSDRWRNLLRTKRLLLEGGTLRVVMLGDSIVNDTSRSCWNLVLERSFPECKVEKITSVRGSTGCWWYKEPGRVHKFVLDHKPKLVIIGGISHRGDIDSIRDVIGQIRAGSNADILLMTGAFGNVNPHDKEQWEKIRDPNHFSDYRRGLENLAHEVGAAFLDMEFAWAKYVRGSGRGLESFKRDPIHANERGEQILGHILTHYLTPEESSVSFVLSRHGCGRATAYSESNKIVSYGDRKTHVSWLDSQDGKFLVRIRTLYRDTGQWSPTYTVGEAFDNHGGPSLTADKLDCLHIVYYPHHHPFRYSHSNPGDASEWWEGIRFGTSCTYSSLICLWDNTLVLACRESSKERWKLNLYEKPERGTWSGPRTILHGQAPSGYTRWQAAMALGTSSERIHMSFMLYEQAIKKVGYAVGYLRSNDKGRTWQRSDGTPVELPATPETIDVVAGARTADGPANFRPGNIAVYRGVPWLIYCRMDRQPFETWIARPDDSGGWRSVSLLPSIQEKWPDRAVKTPGSIAFGRDRRMYIAVTTVDKNVEAESAQWGHPSAEIALLVSDDLGRSFEVFGISSPDPSVPNWLPNLERPTGRRRVRVPALIYTHGLRGTTNKEIMSNEVIWCDLAGFLQGR
ncbi:MAG: BNR-4 repeat-containing protein [Planctomycetota bacterium]|jgi:hypothetical protein